MLIERLTTHIRHSFFSSPSNLMKSTVVDESLSSTTNVLFQGRIYLLLYGRTEREVYTKFKRFYIKNNNKTSHNLTPKKVETEITIGKDYKLEALHIKAVAKKKKKKKPTHRSICVRSLIFRCKTSKCILLSKKS